MSISSSFLSSIGNLTNVANTYRTLNPYFERSQELKQNKIATEGYRLDQKQLNQAAETYRRSGKLPEGAFLYPKTGTEMKIEGKRGIREMLKETFGSLKREPVETMSKSLFTGTLSESEFNALYKGGKH